MYSLGNIGFFAQQGVILYFWLAAYNALRSRRPHSSDRPERIYAISVAVYALGEVIMVGIYFALPFFQVALTSSLLQCASSLIISFGFLVLFWNLRSALKPEERATLLPQKRGAGARRSSGSGSGIARASAGGAYGAVPDAAPAGLSREEEAAARLERERARKMTKIQVIATVCALANLFRGCILIYQATLLTGAWGGFPSGWWVILVLDYSLTEVFAFAAVLYVLRKPPQQPPKLPAPPPRTLLPATAPRGAYDAAPPPPGRMGRSRLPSGSTVSVASSRAGAPAHLSAPQPGAGAGARGDPSGRKQSVTSSAGSGTAFTSHDGAMSSGDIPAWDGRGYGGPGDEMDEEEEEEDWGDSDYSLALESTPSGPPAPIMDGIGRAGDGTAGDAGRSPPLGRAEDASRPIPAGGARAAAAGAEEAAALAQAGSLLLEPVMESVESDSAFPSGAGAASAV